MLGEHARRPDRHGRQRISQDLPEGKLASCWLRAGSGFGTNRLLPSLSCSPPSPPPKTGLNRTGRAPCLIRVLRIALVVLYTSRV